MEGKLEKCLRYAAAALPTDVGDQLRSLITPRAIGVMALMLGVTAGAQMTPYGWVADVIAFCLGACALGSSVWQVGGDLKAFAAELQSAHSERELRAAGQHLARALSVIGVGTFVLWLTKRGARAAFSSQELLSAAKSVTLNPGEREIALWSGVDPLRIPRNYATLEGMLNETPAGRVLYASLKKRDDFARDRDVWYDLSERVSQLAADSDKQVHYFVGGARYDDKSGAFRPGYRAALELDVKGYAKARGVKREVAPGVFRTQYEDEIFHKLEKLNLKGAWIHEVNENGVEVTKFWLNFH